MILLDKEVYGRLSLRQLDKVLGKAYVYLLREDVKVVSVFIINPEDVVCDNKEEKYPAVVFDLFKEEPKLNLIPYWILTDSIKIEDL